MTMDMKRIIGSPRICSSGVKRLPSAMKHLPCRRAPHSHRSRCKAAVASGNKGSLGGWRAEQLEQHMQLVQAVAAPVPPMLSQEDEEDVLIQQKRLALAKSLSHDSAASQHSQNSSSGNGRSSEVLQSDIALSSAEIADMWDFVITTKTASMLAGRSEASSSISTKVDAKETFPVPTSWTSKQIAIRPKAPAKPLLSEADAAVADHISACVTAGLRLASMCESQVLDTQPPELAPVTFPRVPVVRLTIAGVPSSRPPQTMLVLDPLSAPCMLVESDKSSKRKLQQACADEIDEQYNKAWEAAAWADYEAEAAREAADTSPDSSVDEEYMGTSDVGSEDEEPDRRELTAAAAGSGSSHSGSSSQVPGLMTVDVKVLCKTQPGERVWLVGEGQQLGNWKPEGALKMKWNEGHYWTAQITVPKGSWLKYKAILQAADSCWRWEGGCNHEMRVSQNEAVTHKFQ